MAESILHFGAMTLRVNGSGNLNIAMVGLDAVELYEAAPLAMSASPGREPTRLLNFNAQRAQYDLRTTAINEVMNINRIVIWVKELYTQYPG